MDEQEYELRKRVVYRYLCNIADMLDLIEAKKAAVELERETYGLIGVNYAGAGGGALSADAVPNKVISLVAKTKALEDEVNEHMADIQDAKRLCMNGYPETWALWLHLCERKTWLETADEMGYSLRQAIRLGNVGVVKLYDALKDVIIWHSDPC